MDENIHGLLLENSPDSILLVDRDGTIQFINKTTPGFKKEEVLGASVYDYFPVHSQDEYRKILNRLFRAGQPGELNLPIRGVNDNITRWFHIRFVAVKDGKEIVSAMLIGTDITERKNMEMQREQLIHQLQAAQAEVKALKDIIPVCASCKKVRDEEGNWHQIEDYITNNTDTHCSTAICSACYTQHYSANGNDKKT